jgi:hypothetical protein
MRPNAEIIRPDAKPPRRIADHNKTVFLIRVRADRDDASIRALRWLLKRAKRQFGMTALSVTEEAAEQTERSAA